MIDEKIMNICRKIPKAELHLHLEGAIPVETLFRIIKDSKIDFVNSADELRDKFVFRDFPHFIKMWKCIISFIKDETLFFDIARDVVKSLKPHNIKYVEFFCSPGDFLINDLSIRKILKNIIKGLKQAEIETGIKSNLIIDLIRDHDLKLARKYLDTATEFKDSGLIGIGLGGSEQLFPPKRHEELYRIAKERGFRTTVHAGEAAGPESIWQALNYLEPERIGHGVRAIEDAKLIEKLRKHKIPLEVSPVSNVRTRVYETMEEHPVRKLFDAGINMNINTDDPTFFNTDISTEYYHLIETHYFTLEELKILSCNGIRNSFLSKTEKDEYLRIFEKEWEEIIYNVDWKTETRN